MAFEQRENSATLFKNTRKQQDTHADYQGEAKIDGQMYYMNAWVKEGAKGKYFSISFKPKTQKERHIDNNTRAQAPAGHYDDAPF